jgi:hypothetical protein
VSCLNCKAEEEDEEEDEEAVECIGKVAQSWPSSNTPKGGSEEEREGDKGGGKFFFLFSFLLARVDQRKERNHREKGSREEFKDDL